MGARKVDLLRQRDLIAKVPAGTKFVQVLTETGQLKWKEIADVADSDEIQVKANDEPIVMRDKPGRPKKMINLAPANPIVAEILKRKEEAINADPILNIVKQNPESADVLGQIMAALSTEAASIEFDRRESERKGQESGSLSQRRIQALKAIGDTWLKRKEQIAEVEVDFNSPSFKSLFEFIMENFREALIACEVRGEMIETIFSKFAKRIGDEGWEAEARNRMVNRR
jgi:hypothetical protein